jgi:uncharacterized membrane protein
LTAFALLDQLALALFGLGWVGYQLAAERTAGRSRSLNVLMNEQRHRWIEQMVRRDNRILDVQINASLQNGTAFFASTSLIALGAALTLLRSTDDVLLLLSEMPFGLATTRLAWELKVLGLAVITTYWFYKFAWSYRLSNYAAILIGAVVAHDDKARGPAEAARAANMNVVAGRHFTRGLQAFFFALAYLGWFIGPWVLIGSTAVVLIIVWRRQFASDALAALSNVEPWGQSKQYLISVRRKNKWA